MKDSLKLIIGIVMVVVVLWLLSSITGFLIWGAVAAALVAAAYFGLRKVFRQTKTAVTPKGKLKSKEESDIERLIKEMEEMKGKT